MNGSSSSLKSAALLEQMKLHPASEAGKELTKKIGLVYQLNIAPKKMGMDEEIYVVDLKKGIVTKGPYEGKPDATFPFIDNDFLLIATGKMNPQMAFLRGSMSAEVYTGYFSKAFKALTGKIMFPFLIIVY